MTRRPARQRTPHAIVRQLIDVLELATAHALLLGEGETGLAICWNADTTVGAGWY